MKIILASQSPRRRMLLAELGCQFKTAALDIDESFSDELPPAQVAPFLAEQKSMAWGALAPDELLITCDTTVLLNEEVINKPIDRNDAVYMLHKLSGQMHTVVSGVCLRTQTNKVVFSTHTDVQFRELREDEIIQYVDHCHPFDKAGAYGIQDWIGYIGVKAIKGCYYNVMGLPLSDLYEHLVSLGVHCMPSNKLL